MSAEVPPAVLETAHYRLRLLTASDAGERYLGWLRDPEVIRYLEVRHQESTLDDILAYIASHDGRTGFLFGIFTSTSEHIGNFSLRIDPHNRVGTLGVMIGDRSHWGQNVVLEARRAILDFAFMQKSAHKICGACLATNLPAIYNYRRQGWHHEGTRREQALGTDGKRADVVMFGMLASDWYAQKRSDQT